MKYWHLFCVHTCYIVINIFLLISMENNRAIYPCICTLYVSSYCTSSNPLKYNKINKIYIKNALGHNIHALLYNKRVIAWKLVNIVPSSISYCTSWNIVPRNIAYCTRKLVQYDILLGTIFTNIHAITL